MEKQQLARPKLVIETTAPDAARIFTYWLRTVKDYIAYLEEGRSSSSPAVNKARVLISCLSPTVYPLVEEIEGYDDMVKALKAAYVKKKNNVYAGYLLVSHHQQTGEGISEYAMALKDLAKDCTFKNVTAT